MLLKNRRSSWVQLSGHPGSFAPAGLGTLWKKQGPDSTEQFVYEALMNDPARDIVPKYYRDVRYQGESKSFTIIVIISVYYSYDRWRASSFVSFNN